MVRAREPVHLDAAGAVDRVTHASKFVALVGERSARERLPVEHPVAVHLVSRVDDVRDEVREHLRGDAKDGERQVDVHLREHVQ